VLEAVGHHSGRANWPHRFQDSAKAVVDLLLLPRQHLFVALQGLRRKNRPSWPVLSAKPLISDNPILKIRPNGPF
jgi:hypothetical protein